MPAKPEHRPSVPHGRHTHALPRCADPDILASMQPTLAEGDLNWRGHELRTGRLDRGQYDSAGVSASGHLKFYSGRGDRI
jgi:hypothetical protein